MGFISRRRGVTSGDLARASADRVGPAARRPTILCWLRLDQRTIEVRFGLEPMNDRDGAIQCQPAAAVIRNGAVDARCRANPGVKA
jgi:hypothetical protein